MLHPYNGILFSNKKEWNTDSCYNMDEPQKHCAKWKKAKNKWHVKYDSIYMKYPKKANLERQKVD